MDCFICNTVLSVNSISKHFKLVHSEIDTYRCTYGNKCCQHISSLNNFIRHFKSHVQLDIRSNKNHEKTILKKVIQTIGNTSDSYTTSQDVSPIFYQLTRLIILQEIFQYVLMISE